MKKIIYTLLAFLFLSSSAFAQLMSDADHRTMINNFATNVNTVLLTECPQGISLDQFKKNIILGVTTLSYNAKSSINTYSQTLQFYASQFKTTNALVTDNDAQLYFLSSFAPSTNIQNGKLVASTTIANITGDEMWTCAIQSFNTGGNCGVTGMISDKSDIRLISQASATFLSKYADTAGVWIMISSYSDCLSHYSILENVGFTMSRDNTYAHFSESINDFNNLTVVNQESVDQLMAQDTLTTSDMESLAVHLGFRDKEDLDNFQCAVKSDIVNLNALYINANATMLEDKLTILDAADRYKPNYIGNVSGDQVRNLGITMFTGNCSDIPINVPLGKPEQLLCTAEFMAGMLANMPGYDCGKFIYYASQAIRHDVSYSIKNMISDLGGCGLGFTTYTQLKIGWTLGSYISCLIDAK